MANGDIQYIDLIAELATEMDVLGSNVYRGKSFTSLWADVQEKLDLPVLFFEFGSDAYNARERREDEAAQAKILKSQWTEMYNKAYGQGEEGNSIGGFVFEWRDEWWKYQQKINLDIQDNTASWSNKAYLFDWVEGENSMTDEGARRFMAFMKFPSYASVKEYSQLLTDAGCNVLVAEDTGRFPGAMDLYLNMLGNQLTYDALKIIGFNMEMMGGMKGEMEFMQQLAHDRKIIQGIFVAEKA